LILEAIGGKGEKAKEWQQLLTENRLEKYKKKDMK
jgi:hypothetical protein